MGVFSSYFAKLTLLVAILPVLIMGGALGWTYHSTSAQLRSERIHQINDDIAALVDIYTQQGKTGMVRAIENRLQLIPETRARAHYALVNAMGEPVAGDLNADLIGTMASNKMIDWVDEAHVPMVIRSTPLRGGEILYVGRNDETRQNLLSRMRASFMALVLVTLGLGWLAGLYAAHVFKRRVRDINETCAQIAEGHLSARVTTKDTQDELGVLSGNVNAMLERIGLLISLRKNITDQVAHELRSPLTRLDANLLKAMKTSTAPQDIEAARREITNCISLLDALLDVSSLEAQGGDKSGFAPVDLSSLATQMVEFYQGLAEEKDIELRTDIANNILLDGDAMQLSRLIANLIDNAIKYTPNGGVVKISVGGGPILQVEDNGLGVPESLRTSIFTPFFRDPGLKTRRGPDIQGHGLGLALSQAIAKRHNMKLRVSDANPGARFELS